MTPRQFLHAPRAPRAVTPGTSKPAGGRLFRPLVPLVAVLLLAGCGSLLHTPYTTPDSRLPAHWNAAAQAPAYSTADASRDPWWHRFGDPTLDGLIDNVLSANNDLAAATIRVRRAQLQAGLAQTSLHPTVGAGVDASARRNLSDSSERSESYGVSAGISWEADLWGRLGSQRDAARWSALATEEDRQGTALALVGTAMNLYWQGALLNERIAVAQQSIDYAQRTLELVQGQYKAGAVSGLELAEAESTLASQRAGLTQLRQQRVETLNALALLLDGPPSQDLPVPARLPEAPPPDVRAGIPAELLGRRPDLRAAEMRLRATLAGGDSVRASYYPTLSLTGSVGTVSSALANILQNPIAVLGAGIALPFLQWNQMQLDNAVSRTEYEEAVVNFRQTLYEAMGDVENTLSARGALAEQTGFLQQSLASAQRAETLYEAQYRAGAVPLRTWLDAQERRRQAEVAVSENRYAQYLNQVALYQALGGDAIPAVPERAALADS